MKLLDGELESEDRTEYQQHVQDCEECAKELEEMGRIVRLTDELRLKKPDDEF